MTMPEPIIMDKHPANMLVSVFRGGRLALHVFYAMLLAVIYPHLNQTGQRRILKSWSRQLLTILNIGIQIEGQQLARGESGCLMVANHVSWLDIFVLNAIHPSRFIAKSEVRDWPIFGWLSRRIGTIFIERAMRQDASRTSQHVGFLLKQGACIGLFPEGTTTDGRQVGRFHSALIQPSIDAGIRLCPVALRYQDRDGGVEIAAAFVGDMTLAQSIWQILRCPQHNALVVFVPALLTDNANRRVLARAAQDAISQMLQTLGTARQPVAQQQNPPSPQTLLSSQSAYALLVDPLLNQPHK
jgi:1-acyl-sn-glycerol-3-phosphate acyltransferase